MVPPYAALARKKNSRAPHGSIGQDEACSTHSVSGAQAQMQWPVIGVARASNRSIAIDRVASTSFIAALSAEVRAEVLRQVQAFPNSHPATRDRPVLDLPYHADIYWCTRRP